jgi:two-component system, OmpR family, sensor histidine kinase RstB
VLKFYLRTVWALVIATLATTLVLRVFVESPLDELTLRLMGGHASVHVQAIARVPPAERRAAVQELSAALGYPVHTQTNKGGQAVRTEWRGADLYVLAPGMLAFGPLPYGRAAALTQTIFVALLVSLVVAAFAVRPLVARVRSLQAASTRMCRGDFTVRVPSDVGDMLESIGGSLNQLAERIGQLLSDERDLLRTVAHEVRAPISRMRFRVERIQERAADADQKDTNGLVADLQQVDNLFEELLTYVAFDEFDYERPALQTSAIEVLSTVQRLVNDVTSTEPAVSVHVQGAEGAKIVANPKLFDRAVTNLLLNAVAYGGGRISIFVREFPKECVVDVQDAGPGIPERDRPRVVKPFVRLASKKTRGTGLGLAIVNRIMNLHHGSLHIVDAPTGGASIQLVWRNAAHPPRSRWHFGSARRSSSS